jgi:hypothetical protein
LFFFSQKNLNNPLFKLKSGFNKVLIPPTYVRSKPIKGSTFFPQAGADVDAGCNFKDSSVLGQKI